MTLTVIVRVPDGIVIAADSLVTITKTMEPKKLTTKCPKCKEKIQISDLKMPPISVPAGSSCFARKLFKIGKRNIGVATFGAPSLAGRTIESHIRAFEKTKIVGEESVEEVAKKMRDFFSKALKKAKEKLPKPAKGQAVVGFQVAGYDEKDVKIGKTFVLKMGQQTKIEPTYKQGYGCNAHGDHRVVAKLWKKDPQIPIAKPIYRLMTLQDAIDYAIFLIRTTIDYQRFATMVPNVGGSIDVAIITHHAGFQWVQKKKYLGERNEHISGYNKD